MSKQRIPVRLGTTFQREAVLIDPNASAAEPTFDRSNPTATQEAFSNVLATGKNSRAVLKEIYGR